jgi:serpin B
MKGGRFAALVVFLLTVTGCQGQAAAPLPVRHLDSRLAVSSNDFGVELVDLLLAGNNLVLSPLSASIALSMAASGAGGDTRSAMLTGLGLDPGADPGLEARTLTDELTAPAGSTELEIANAVWTQKGSPPPTAAYRDQLRTNYRAKLGTLDFRSPAARKTVNDWVSSATHQKIKTLFDDLDPATVAVLVNATYFHGYWQTQFDPHLTRQADFETFSGATSRVAMMGLVGKFAFHWSPDLQAVLLPYAGDRFSLLVIVPAARLTAAEFVRWLTPELWSSVRSSLQVGEVGVGLPRFTIDTAVDLIPALEAMGMKPAFGPGADFSAICGGCWISQVRQVARIEVDEQGTRAAAATGISMATSGPPGVVADHPFAFGLIDNATGSPLFLGVVGNP